MRYSHLINLYNLLCNRALLSSELQTIFSEAPLAPNAMAHSSVREAYERVIGKASTSKEVVGDKRIPGPEDDCPICYETMHGSSLDSLTFCEECKNALHAVCFRQCIMSS